MTILPQKPYSIKVSPKEEGRQKYPKIYPRGFWMAPSPFLINIASQMEGSSIIHMNIFEQPLPLSRPTINLLLFNIENIY